MPISIAKSFTEIAADEWNALDLGGNPFLRHEFLLALEICECADERSGWQAQHLLLRDETTRVLIGAVPLYLKSHSFGEFVFDWSWAGAYAQHGLDYYPKLTSAVPFTPASGPRLLVRTGTHSLTVRKQLAAAICDLARDRRLSSAHVLFVNETDRAVLESLGFLLRCDCQFQWRNHAYANFDAFLATFRADKRKKTLRERRRIAEADIRFEVRTGGEMTDDLWNRAFAMSAATFARHGREHYLSAAFFKTMAKTLPESQVVVLAFRDSQPIAAAICFRGDDTLYGRYWGQESEVHSLHFETCYYQGIDYCIHHGLTQFEPGTQGEHKIVRGFEPTLTWSAHWIADRRFAAALDAHLARERDAVASYQLAMREHLPFHHAV